MNWLHNVTLQEAYKLVRLKKCFALWIATGNYMNHDAQMNGCNVETRIFLGESLFLLGLSVEIEGSKVMASRAHLIDIWPSIQTKYPKLLEAGVTGDLWLIP